MKKIVKVIIRVVFFIPVVLTLPIAALGYWQSSKDATYPQAVKTMFSDFMEE